MTSIFENSCISISIGITFTITIIFYLILEIISLRIYITSNKTSVKEGTKKYFTNHSKYTSILRKRKNVLLFLLFFGITISLSINWSYNNFPRCNNEKIIYQIDTVFIEKSNPKVEITQNKISEIKNFFHNKVNNNYYKSVFLPDNDLIENKTGFYYKIDLKNSNKEGILYFKGGEFAIKTFNNEFLKNMEEFLNDVDQIRNHKINFQIYTLGRADLKANESFKGNLTLPLKINIHKEIEQDKFEYAQTPITIPSIFTNIHLPNLRANFIKQKIETHPSNFDVEILEGRVEKEINSLFRNTTMIIYIEDWKLNDDPKE